MSSVRSLAHAGASDEIASSLLLVGAVWVAWIAWSRLRGKGFPRVSRPVAWGMLPAAAGLLVAGIVLPRAILGPTTTPPGSRIASTATLSFVQPAADRLTTDGTMEVVLDLQGGTIVDTAMTDIAPDTGHIHLVLDGELVSMTYGTVQPLDIRDLDGGEHELRAEYVAADHAPFEPRVTARTTFRTGTAP